MSTIKATYIVDVKDSELVSLNKEMEQFQKNAKANDQALKKNTTSTKTAGQEIGKYVAGYAALGLAIKKAVDFTSDAVDAYNEQAIATARLESIAYGVADATEAEVDALKKLADEYQKVTTFGDEVIESGQSQILSFGVTAEQAGQLTGSLTDLLAANKGVNATSQDAIEASNMLGKALNGQAGALSRAGILMTDRQKQLVQEGDQSTRVAAIVEVMSDNYGGLAETLAKTDAGQLIQANNEIGDMMERIGSGLIPVQTELANLQSVLISKFAGTEDGINSLGNALTKTVRVFTVGAEGMFLAGELINGSIAGLLELTAKLPFVGKEFKAFAQAYGEESRAGIQNALDGTMEAMKSVADEVVRSESAYNGNTEAVTANTVAISENAEALKQQEDLIKARKQAWKEIETFQFSVQDRETAKTNAHFQEMMSLFEGDGKAQIDMRTKIEDEWTRVLEEIQSKRDEASQAKREEEDEKEKARKTQQIDDFTSYANTVSGIVQTITEARIRSINAEEAREISAIKDSTKNQEQKAKEISKIEKKAEAERKSAAMADWGRSIAMSLVNTALGVTKTMATMGYPAGIPLAAAVAATGAVSTGAIIANKPKFEDGGIVGGMGGGRQGPDNVEAVLGENERVITVDQQLMLSDFFEGKMGGGGTNITINAVSSEGVEDAVLSALYNAQQNNKVDKTILSIGAN